MGKKNERGWIKLYRQLDELDFYFSERFSKVQAWIDILLLATHKPRTVFIRGIEIKLKPGELAWSITSLAKRWRWNERTVKRFLNMLEERQMIHRKSDNVSTIISVKNWLKYQGHTQQSTPQNTEQMQSRIQTNKNDKNDKNNIKERKRKKEKERKEATNPMSNASHKESEKHFPSYKREFTQLLARYNELFGKQHRPTPGRLRKYRLRRVTFTAAEIATALENLARSPWHRGENDRGWVADLDFLLRSDEQVDKWLNFSKKKGGTSRWEFINP